MYEGKILDGRNRVAAAKRAGQTKIIYTGFEGSFEQARDFVIARPHLDTGQRGMIAAELVTLQRGSNPQNCGLPAEGAAKQLNASTRTVETAKAIRKADPVLADEVKQGKTKLRGLRLKTDDLDLSLANLAIGVRGHGSGLRPN